MIKSQTVENDFYDELDAEVGYSDLKNEIDAILARGQEAEYRDGAHLSDIRSGYCHRMVVLSHFYQSNLVFHSAKTAAIFENGRELHRRWQKFFENAGVALMVERAHQDMYYDAYFTPDVIIRFRGEPHVVELKGYKQETYVKLVTGKKAPQDAILQCQMYMHTTGIRKGLVIVENKNTQDYAVWPVNYAPETCESQLQELDLCRELCKIHVELGRLPKPLEVCTSLSDDRPKSCRYCTACFASKQERAGMKL